MKTKFVCCRRCRKQAIVIIGERHFVVFSQQGLNRSIVRARREGLIDRVVGFSIIHQAATSKLPEQDPPREVGNMLLHADIVAQLTEEDREHIAVPRTTRVCS